MGWGTAFATGLVKGFTNNIKEEEAKRLSDQIGRASCREGV